jgi:4-hydroxybenzoate polyprenyltransferase
MLPSTFNPQPSTALKHTLTYYISSYSLVGILAGIFVIVVLIACWAAIEIWREEIKLRRERDAELAAHRAARKNLVNHLIRK